MWTVLQERTVKMTLEETNVLYLDYNWDLSRDRIVLDEELDLDRLGWNAGDFFQLINIDGRAQLERVDPLVVFTMGQPVNERKQNGHS
jgi:hypothetical protein